MPTESDTLEALRNRLTRRLQELENERSELVEAIRVLGDAPRLLSRESREPQRAPGKSELPTQRAQSNRNVTQLVRDFIDGFEREKAINVPELVKTL